jgi:outer membrane protein assembly factor BamB
MRSTCCWSVVLLALLPRTAAADSLGWRGNGTGQYPEAGPPIEWDAGEEKNIFWQAKVGKSQSCPIVVGDRLFLTVEPDVLVCVDRHSGKVLWKAANGYASLPAGLDRPKEMPATSPNCGYASATPISDGTSVYAVYGTGVVASYAFDGRLQWVQCFDRQLATQYGRSVSPLLAAGKLLVSIGGLAAIDPGTGKQLWETRGAKPTYGTPAVAKLGDVSVAITPAGDCVRLSDGRILAKKLASGTYSSPVVSGRIVFFAGPPTVAIELPEAAAETIEPKTLWEADDPEGEMFASPLVHEGLVYVASNEGLFWVLDSKTGKTVYEKELTIRNAAGKPGSEPANIYPSPTLAGKHILLGNDAGEMLVLEPGRQYKEAARNDLGMGNGGSPVPEGKQLFLRGRDVLFCIGGK